MIGGSPILPPGYAPYYPPAPAVRPAALPQRRPAAAPALARSKEQQPATQGRFRLQGAEDASPRPVLPPLEMPSPESLARASANHANQEVDWAAVRQRLESVHATSFHLQRVANGFRFSCVVPTVDGGRRKLEAEAASEGAAIDAALHNFDRAE